MTISDRQFYLFLNSYNDWKTKADSYGVGSAKDDGTLNRGEFNKFVKAEWSTGGSGDASAWYNEGEQITNSIINKFWAKFDTDATSDANFNRLDDEELANMNKGVGAYAAIRALVDGLAVPNDFKTNDKTVKTWRDYVYNHLEELATAYVDGGCKGEMEIPEEKVVQAQSLATAYCYRDSLITKLPEDVKSQLQGYNLKDDKGLATVIDNYIENLNPTEFSADSIKNAIQSIINEYLATAGIGKVEGFVNFPQGDNDAINELQRHKATKHLESLFTEANLKNITGYSTGVKDAFVTCYQSYIENVTTNATTVADYNAIMKSTFESIKAVVFADIDTIIKKEEAKKEVEKLFADLEADTDNKIKVDTNNALHKAISDKYSSNVQDGMEYFNKIKNNLKDQVINNIDEYLKADNTLDVEKIKTLVLEEIEKAMKSDDVGNREVDDNTGLSVLKYDELKTHWNNYLRGLDRTEDDAYNKAINKAAAVCRRLAEIDPKYEEKLFEILDIKEIGDITEKLAEKCKTVNQVDNLMSQIWAACDEIEIVDISECTPNWGSLNAIDNLTINVGDKKVYNMGAAGVTTPNGSQMEGKITYKITSNLSATSYDPNTRNIVIAGSLAGVETISIEMFIDGKSVGTKEISLNITHSASSVLNSVTGWGGAKSEHLEVFNADDKGYRDKQVTDCDFATLYNSDAIIRLRITMDDSEGWSKAKSTVTNRITALGQHICSALSTTGMFDTSILEQAANNVSANYITAMNNASKKYNDNDHGKNQKALTNNLVNYMNSNRESTGHRIWGTRDDDGDDSYVWGVRFKDFVDDIITEYYRLLGSPTTT